MINFLNKKYFVKENENFVYGFLLFNIGIFLLGSAPFISVILIFISLLISIIFLKSDIKIYKPRIIFLCSLLLILNTTTKYLLKDTQPQPWSNELNFTDLFNWLPFFISFYLVQPYLKSFRYRNIISFLLLSGTVPIIITGLGQYFLGWNEQLSTLNGNIIWFLKPLNEVKGVSGIFNNSNYAGSWLSIVWPISLAFFIKNKISLFKKLVYFLYFNFLFVTMLLTNSKDTFLTFLLPIPFLFKLSIFKMIIFTLIFFIFICFYFLNPIQQLNLIFHKNYLLSFNFAQIINIFPRIDVWRVSLIAIIKNPLFGFGASTFPIIYALNKHNSVNDIIQHSHNLFFEITFNYGLITSGLIFYIFINILIESWMVIFKKEDNVLNKAWWFSTLLFLINHLFDVTYYDVRISLSFWILLSGLYCIIYQHKFKNNLNN